jgi:TPR repeat protein
MFKQCSDTGYADCQLMYGAYLQQGKGVKQNLTKSVEYFKLYAGQGCPEAQALYGHSCMEGIGISDNPEEGVK